MPDLTPGVPSALSPLVRRIVAPNPGPFTGPGTNTYLVGIDEVAVIAPGGEAGTDLVALDEALVALARIDPRKAQIVEMRFFAGLTVEEIGSVLKVSAGTIKRDWRAAKAWLYRELSREPG